MRALKFSVAFLLAVSFLMFLTVPAKPAGSVPRYTFNRCSSATGVSSVASCALANEALYDFNAVAVAFCNDSTCSTSTVGDTVTVSDGTNGYSCDPTTRSDQNNRGVVICQSGSITTTQNTIMVGVSPSAAYTTMFAAELYSSTPNASFVSGGSAGGTNASAPATISIAAPSTRQLVFAAITSTSNSTGPLAVAITAASPDGGFGTGAGTNSDVAGSPNFFGDGVVSSFAGAIVAKGLFQYPGVASWSGSAAVFE